MATSQKVLNCEEEYYRGCPLSTHLFIIAFEMLAVKIRSNIKGIEIQGLKIKVSLYADE
jgi:hypothetical protein